MNNPDITPESVAAEFDARVDAYIARRWATEFTGTSDCTRRAQIRRQAKEAVISGRDRREYPA
jgi:hypothetical protein